MTLFKTRSAALYGIDAHLIDVEVDMYKSGSARDFITVGMPDTAARESRKRIRSALMNSGFGYPNKAVTINLAPANVPRVALNRGGDERRARSASPDVEPGGAMRLNWLVRFQIAVHYYNDLRERL